jgi:hypothetical protein
MKYLSILLTLLVVGCYTAPAMAQEYYCVPYEQGVQYQEENGWLLTNNQTKKTRGNSVIVIDRWYKYAVITWAKGTGSMITIGVPMMYDFLDGRHKDMMCKVR